METNRGEMPNVIKNYRMAKGLTQRELAEEMSKDFPYVDTSLISKFENEVCLPTEAVREWTCKRINDLLAERNQSKGMIYHSQEKLSKNGDFSPLARNVFELIKSADGRITREELTRKTGANDRMVREAIEELRSNKIRIGSGGGASGYFICKTESEYKRFIPEYTSRAYKIIRNKEAMDSYTEGQIEI